jgi:hypothetical protein
MLEFVEEPLDEVRVAIEEGAERQPAAERPDLLPAATGLSTT